MEFVYIDVVGKIYNFQNHLVKLEQVLKRMRLHGLKMDPTKCAFGISGGIFFGFLDTYQRDRSVEK